MSETAERRMFAKTIIDSDMFLEMPLTSQLLYFHLAMRADDDGFVNNPKRILRMIGTSEDDLKMLIAKNFIIPFDSGVVVIKHWRIHNYIQKDRYKSTACVSEKMQLSIEENGSYEVVEKSDPSDVYSLDTECIQNVYRMDTQVRLGKESIGKDRESINNNTCAELDNPSHALIGISLQLIDNTKYEVTEEDLKIWEDAFPAVDVRQELKKMVAWIMANPNKRKTKRGIKRFVNLWLERVQNKGGNRQITQEIHSEPKPPAKEESPPINMWDVDDETYFKMRYGDVL